MARSRLYLMPEDHDHFLRIFPEARVLPWTHIPERGCWQVEFDLDAPTPAEMAALGETRVVCLERLRRIGHDAPPGAGNEPHGGAEDPLDGETSPKAPLVRPFLLLIFILVVVGAGVVWFFSSDPETEPAVAVRPDPSSPASVPEERPAAGSSQEETQFLQGEIIQMLNRCRQFLKDGNLTTGEAGNALDCYRKILERVPDNVEALTGLRRIEQHYIGRAEFAIKRGRLQEAHGLLATLAEVNPRSPHLSRLRQKLKTQETADTGITGIPEQAMETRASPPPPPSRASAPSASMSTDPAAAPSSAPGDRVPAPTNDDPPMNTETLIQESLGTGFQPSD